MDKADNDKPLALLIPGLDGTGRLFYRQIDALSKHYRVLPWEFRPRDSFALADLVEEIAVKLENEESGSSLVVGESFGGMIALQLALDHPDRIKHLGLINAFPYYRRRNRIRLACRLAGLLDKPFAKMLKDFVADRTLAAEGILPEDRALFREAIGHVYHPAYCFRLNLVRDMDLRCRLPEIKIPVSIFASGRDKLVPSVDEARLMQSVIKGARVFEFPRAGHALLLTPGFSLAEYLD